MTRWISVSQAARIVGKSSDWVRNRLDRFRYVNMNADGKRPDYSIDRNSFMEYVEKLMHNGEKNNAVK